MAALSYLLLLLFVGCYVNVLNDSAILRVVHGHAADSALPLAHQHSAYPQSLCFALLWAPAECANRDGPGLSADLGADIGNWRLHTRNLHAHGPVVSFHGPCRVCKLSWVRSQR
jgi:hypothetical protein